jgi:S-adenosylmethionine-dependent methyltransferase
MTIDKDRNFDDLADKFARKIYGGLKGDIRLAVIWRDLLAVVPAIEGQTPLRILDVGGGLGQFTLRLAGLGHSLIYSDLSQNMLSQTQQQAEAQGLQSRIQWLQCPYQELQSHLADEQGFDLVLCHAVAEWLAEPHKLVDGLKPFLKPDGKLSLTYYNQHSLVYRNLIRGNFKMLDNKFIAHPGSLTPGKPLDPGEVSQWVANADLSISQSSGIRVFHDYVSEQRGGHAVDQSVIAMELKYSLLEPYKWLGRYIHLLISAKD